jgi:hypothetical protein
MSAELSEPVDGGYSMQSASRVHDGTSRRSRASSSRSTSGTTPVADHSNDDAVVRVTQPEPPEQSLRRADSPSARVINHRLSSIDTYLSVEQTRVEERDPPDASFCTRHAKQNARSGAPRRADRQIWSAGATTLERV